MGITTWELNAMRDHLKQTLPTTCTIEQGTWVSDGMGGGTYHWSNRATSVPCRLSPAGPGMAGITQQQIREGMVWVLSIPGTQTITVQDRVVVDSKTYAVTQVNVGESEIGLVRVYMDRLE